MKIGLVDHTPAPFRLGRHGFSQAELMITLLLLSIGFLAAVGAFKGMSKGIFVTKAKSLATNLAQEKVEFLKDKGYYRLRVTSTTVQVAGLTPAVYQDPYNYGKESLNIGGIPFDRYVVVDKVQKAAGSNNLETVAWNATDTGLKRVTVTVVWKEGAESKQLKLMNLRENPSRSAANVSFQGNVKSTAGANLANVRVEVVENPSWSAATDASGNYSFNLSPGTWTVRASSAPYFTVTQSNKSIGTTNTPVTVDFDGSNGLPRKSSGTVKGYLWIRDHLVISQIVGSSSTASFDQEWVEIYNPTTWTWTATDLGLRFQRRSAIDAVMKEISLVYVTANIPPNSYYLFANTGTVSAVGSTLQADAKWDLAAGTNDLTFADRFSSADPNIITTKNDNSDWAAGGLQLYRKSDGAILDRFGWARNEASQSPPDDVKEGTAYQSTSGLQDKEQFYRLASTNTAYNPAEGSAYDSGNNNADVKALSSVGWVPRNTASASVTPVAGTPAVGAYVFADDGFSQLSVAYSSGSTPYAYFSLSSIATGTWSFSSSSGTLYNSRLITVTSGSQETFTLHLTTYTDSGYVSGKVSAVGGAALSNIEVDPGNVYTDASGNYRLTLPPGVQNVTVNPGRVSNSTYIESSLSTTVVTGQIVTNFNFTLSGGGKIRGRVTSDGTNALPDVPVSVTNQTTSLEVANILSGIDGYFEVSVPTASYYVAPIGQSGEVVTPSTAAVNLTTGGSTVFASTFTIGPALGTIRGNVKVGTSKITTGVLLIASTQTVTNPPPDLNNALRSGSRLYYVGSSGADGTYELDVRQGTYYVYGWYTTFSGNTPTSTVRSVSNVSVTAGNTTSTGTDLTW